MRREVPLMHPRPSSPSSSKRSSTAPAASSGLSDRILSMHATYLKTGISALLIAVIAVFGVDYFYHLLFSSPMETIPYFLTKFFLYFVFSIAFLSICKSQDTEFGTVAGAGIVVAALWGLYYNVLPLLFGYYPFGISLNGLTFLGMGILGTGLAFGVVHTLAFIVGYYTTTYITKL